MRNTSGSLFDFLENTFGLSGLGRSARTGHGEAEIAVMPTAEIRRRRGAANENAARGLTPIVSMAVSVCPVPPIVKRAS